MTKTEKLIWDKLKYIIKGMIVILIFWYSKYLQYIPIKLFNLDIKNLSDTTKVVLSCFSTLMCVFIFFFIYRKDLKNDFKSFFKNREENMDIGIRYWIIGLISMMAINFILNFILKAGGANNEQSVQRMIKAFPLLMLLDAGIIAPFVEEIVFRKTLYDIFKNKWLFIISSFLLFGAAHVMNSAEVLTDYLYIISYGMLGASLALAYYKTNTIFTSVFLHMLHNTILIILSVVTTLL